jgi:hypothetical protein
MLRNEMCLNIIVIVSTIFAATIIMVTLTRFANIGIAQGQVDNNNNNNSSSLLQLTPQQRATMCNPNNPSSKLDFVNTTESMICGIPKTPANTTTEEAASNAPTTGTETPSSSGASTPPSDTQSSSSTSTTTVPNQSSLYKQGYANGVADSKSVQVTTPPIGAMMRPDDVDCNSDIDPQTSNQDYCSGYQHGFADTFNNALSGK